MGSSRFQINWVDVRKTIRTAVVVFGGAFCAGVVGFVKGADLQQIIALDPRAILALVSIAGLSGVIELLRRYVTDYSGTATITAPQA